jgi:GNAT superfamily N-acetyltransferase
MFVEQSITLCPATSQDQPFLYTVYASTRVEELALLNWNEAQRAAFLHMQFSAQDTYYRQHYPQGDFSLILLAGEPVGRLYVERRTEQILVIDISLLPDHRNLGIGSALLQKLLDEGASCRLPVRLHVMMNNPAYRLYARMGFVPAGNDGAYIAMEWRSSSGTDTDEGNTGCSI